jgi:hypothetical protein
MVHPQVCERLLDRARHVLGLADYTPRPVEVAEVAALGGYYQYQPLDTEGLDRR